MDCGDLFGDCVFRAELDYGHCSCDAHFYVKLPFKNYTDTNIDWFVQSIKQLN